MKTCSSVAIFVLLLYFSIPTQLCDGDTVVKTMQCLDGSEILITSLCDGINDCGDGSDENYLGRGFKCKPSQDSIRDCVVPQDLLRDQVSHCIDESDLCFDGNGQLNPRKCFQCLNGHQLVALNQVCDGVVDCDDFSDECLCLNNGINSRNFTKNPICNHVCSAWLKNRNSIVKQDSCRSCEIGEFQCMLPDSNSSYSSSLSVFSHPMFQGHTCLPLHKVCNGIHDCPNGEDEMYCTTTMTCDDDKKEATACDGRITCADFSDECTSKCWNQPEYCESIDENRFQCDAHNETNREIFNTTTDHMQLCNLEGDCPITLNDERLCSKSTHYYCWSGKQLFVNQSDRFNEVSDCEDGSDECSGMFNHTEPLNMFYTRNQIVRHTIFQIMLWIVGVIALTGNIMVIASTSRELWKDRHVEALGRLAKCNRNFVLNLAVADFIMGVSLLMLAINGVVLSNNYCDYDRTWRTGRMCVMMGILTQCSSQTSVFMLLLMTSYRLYGTLHPFRVEESKLMGGATAATFAAWTISIILAVIPQAGFVSDYFTYLYWFPVPFANHDLLNRGDMEDLVLNIYTFSSDSRRIPLPGFYTRYPICQPLFYAGVNETGWEYMTAIVAFNFVAFIYIAIAYLVIYKASSRPCVRKSVRKRTKQWRKDNHKMQKKIFFLIFTDMACWLPICIITAVRLYGIELHYIVHGVTGVLLLPVNSALNPLVYSSVYNTFFCRLCKKKSPFDPPSSSIEATNSIKGSLGSLLNIKSLVSNSPMLNNNRQRVQKHRLKEESNSKPRRVRFTSESSSRASLADDLEEKQNLTVNDTSLLMQHLETNSGDEKEETLQVSKNIKTDLKESKL